MLLLLESGNALCADTHQGPGGSGGLTFVPILRKSLVGWDLPEGLRAVQSLGLRSAFSLVPEVVYIWTSFSSPGHYQSELPDPDWTSLVLSSAPPAEYAPFLECSWCLRSVVCSSPSSRVGGKFPLLCSFPDSWSLGDIQQLGSAVALKQVTSLWRYLFCSLPSFFLLWQIAWPDWLHFDSSLLFNLLPGERWAGEMLLLPWGRNQELRGVISFSPKKPSNSTEDMLCCTERRLWWIM